MDRSRKPPLRLRVLYHPSSEGARKLASELYRAFMQEAGTPGLRIPVLYGPAAPSGEPPGWDDLDLDGATHSLVLVLVDERMARRVGPAATAGAWGDLLVDLLRWAPAGQGPHAVLPVAVDGRAFELDDRLDRTSFIPLHVTQPEQRGDELAFQVAVRSLHLLIGGELPADGEATAPVELFISHTKRNLPRDPDKIEGPVKALLAHLAQGPVEHWYDAKHIPPGGRFDEEIKAGVLRSSAMVCVVTDDYSSREWCRREALEAKYAGRPLLVVNALIGEVPRTFPYLGNAPEVRWNRDEDARRVIRLAVREALRYQHGLRVLEARKGAGDVVLGTAPEALTVAGLPAGTKRVLYPDLPLGQEELGTLEKLVPGTDFTTPLSTLARWQRPPGVDLIGLSLSNSPDAPAYGMSEDHLATFAEDTCLFLLLAGLRLGYGGMIGHEGAGPNYVERLFAVARSHSPLGERVGADFQPVANYVGWPVHQRYGDEEYRLYGREAELVTVDQPPDLGLDPAALEPDDDGYFPPTADDPDLAARRRYAWARGMTAMRQRMTADVTARVILGGKLEGYAGVLPGVLEEALLSLRAGRPVYLAGAFGGAAQVVVEALEGRRPPALTPESFRQRVPHYDRALALFEQLGRPLETPEVLAEELAERGRAGPAAALDNGLGDEENRELFTSSDPLRLVELILLGLARWSERHRS